MRHKCKRGTPIKVEPRAQITALRKAAEVVPDLVSAEVRMVAKEAVVETPERKTHDCMGLHIS